jgi:hypothetical protein
MLVCNSDKAARQMERFFEDYHYDYEYAELGISVNTDSLLGVETRYPKNIVKAVLKNNNIKDSESKVIYLISREYLDKALFDSEVELFQREINEVISHTQYNVSIGFSGAKGQNRGHVKTNTRKSVGEQCQNSR